MLDVKDRGIGCGRGRGGRGPIPHAGRSSGRTVRTDSRHGIVKLFGNACGAVAVSGPAGKRWWLTASFKPLRR